MTPSLALGLIQTVAAAYPLVTRQKAPEPPAPKDARDLVRRAVDLEIGLVRRTHPSLSLPRRWRRDVVSVATDWLFNLNTIDDLVRTDDGSLASLTSSLQDVLLGAGVSMPPPMSVEGIVTSLLVLLTYRTAPAELKNCLERARAEAASTRDDERAEEISVLLSTLQQATGLLAGLWSTPRLSYRHQIDRRLSLLTDSFVGRRDLIDQLAGVAPGEVILIEADPGAGKSALCARLLLDYEEGRWSPSFDLVVATFISIDAGATDATWFMRAVNQQLAAAVDEAVPLGEDLTDMRARAADLLHRLDQAGQDVLLIVDGLDEQDIVNGRSPSVTLALEGLLTTNVGLICTSRRSPAPFKASGPQSLLRSARLVTLQPLTESELSLILSERGLSLTSVGEVARISRGNALYVRALCDDMVENGGRIATGVDDETPPALGAYFEHQFQLLRRDVEDPLAWTVLVALAAAAGPMCQEDLRSFLAIDDHQLHDGLLPIRRYLVPGLDLQFAHVELRRQIARAVPGEVGEARRRILDWGRLSLAGGASVSEYVVRNHARGLYEARHFDELLNLPTDRWLSEHLRVDRHLGGFAADCILALSLADQLKLPPSPSELRVSYLLALAHTRSANYPSSLLVQLASHGEGTRAIEIASMDPEMPTAVAKLCDIASGSADNAAAALLRAEQIATTIVQPWVQTGAWTRIIQVGGSTHLLGVALETARVIADPQQRALALTRIAQCPGGDGIFEEAQVAAEAIPDPRERGQALAALVASILAHDDHVELATSLARSIDEPSGRATALTTVARSIGLPALLHEAAETARTIGDPWRRFWALKEIAVALGEPLLLDELVAVARNSTDPKRRSHALATLVFGAVSAPALVAQAQQIASLIEDGRMRDHAFATVVHALAGAPDSLPRAEELTMGISDSLFRSCALSDVVGGLCQQEGRQSEAIQLARSIPEPRLRVEAMVAIVISGGSHEVLLEAEEHAVAAVHRWTVDRTVAAIARGLAKSPELTDDAIDAVRRIASPDLLVSSLLAIVQLGGRGDLLLIAAQIAENVVPIAIKAELLVEVVAAGGPPELLGEARELVNQVGDPQTRVRLLLSLVRAGGDLSLLERAAMLAAGIDDPLHRNALLADVVVAMSDHRDLHARAEDLFRGLSGPSRARGGAALISAVARESGNWDRAVNLATHEADPVARDWMLVAVVEAGSAAAQGPPQVAGLADTIVDPWLKDSAVYAIVKARASRGEDSGWLVHAASAMSTAEFRTKTYVVLAETTGDPSFLHVAEDCAGGIGSAVRRGEALEAVALASERSVPDCRPLLDSLAAAPRLEAWLDAFGAVAPFLGVLGRPDLLLAVRDMIAPGVPLGCRL